MAEELPYKCEYAKTGRAGCKGCKEKIGQNSLRLAVMVQSAFHDGKQPNWFHFECFFKKHRPASDTLFDGFLKIRLEDQKKINEYIGASSSCVVAEDKGKGKKRGAEDAGTSNLLVNDFGIEYAKRRVKCTGCDKMIFKGEIRIKKTVYDTETAMKYGSQAIWHHVDCFAKLRAELGWFASADMLPDYGNLTPEDKESVMKNIPAIKPDAPSEKKPKTEDKADSALNAKIEKQNKEFFKLRDELQANTSKADWIEILNANNQSIPNVNSEILDHVTDVILFGAIERCDKCNDGSFILGNSAYLCSANISEWAKCDNVTKEPKRTSVKIPKSLQDRHSFLAKKFKVQTRALRDVAPIYSNTGMAQKNGRNSIGQPRVQRENPPLYNMEFVVVGKTEKPRNEIKKIIEVMGGKVYPSIHPNIVAVISNKNVVKRVGSSNMNEAKKFGIQIVPEDFLDDVKNGDALSLIVSKSLCDWGTDPKVRLRVEETKKSESKSIFTKSVPKSQKLVLKDGTAVDPDSGLQHYAHVYCEGPLKYFAILGFVDVANNKNSFYKLQLIESDDRKKYWVFRSWGRISTMIGGNKTEQFSNMQGARKEFMKQYEDKTGNIFGADEFVKHSGKFYKLDIDYGNDPEVKKFCDSIVESKLAPPVQHLIKLIFDEEVMKKMMLEFDLDTAKMPLGKLSKKQLQEAMLVLKEISESIQSNAPQSSFIDASNRFYTLVPHDFGVERAPIINTDEQVTVKTEMIASLMEIELAYDLLNKKMDENKSPIDAHYEQLKTDIVPMDKDSEEFKLLCQYVKSSHGSTHSSFELEVDEIFKVTREGEHDRFEPFKKLHNHQLLWHGSRLTNFVGILSNGLRIAPPEAPAHGYMFGKGIYFADMVSKSANYCCTTPQSRTGLMLLCDVALGNTLNLDSSCYITQLPKDKHSTKGVGRCYPHYDGFHIREDGVKIPLGPGITDPSVSSCLLYNEYIIYDVAQVKIEYLLKMDFKYKY